MCTSQALSQQIRFVARGFPKVRWAAHAGIRRQCVHLTSIVQRVPEDSVIRLVAVRMGLQIARPQYPPYVVDRNVPFGGQSIGGWLGEGHVKILRVGVILSLPEIHL